MNSEYWFSELSGSLRNGFFSDAVVLELARIARDRAVSPEQARLFERAAEVLQLAKEGSQWLDNPRMSERSSTCASFFGQAVEAMSVVLTPEDFLKRIDKLSGIAKTIAQGTIPSQEDLQSLRKFFFYTGRSELQRTEQLMDGGTETSRFKWLAAR